MCIASLRWAVKDGNHFEGFNVISGSVEYPENGAKARISIISNNEHDCISCDSKIGFGMVGVQRILTHAVMWWFWYTTQKTVKVLSKPWDTCLFSKITIFLKALFRIFLVSFAIFIFSYLFRYSSTFHSSAAVLQNGTRTLEYSKHR